jgi:hypothetical protein
VPGGAVVVVLLVFVFVVEAVFRLRRLFSAVVEDFFFFLPLFPLFFLLPLAAASWISPTPRAVSNASPAAPSAPMISRRSPVLARDFSDCSKRVSSGLEAIPAAHS